MYKSESAIGIISTLPSSTLEPFWFNRLICLEMD